MVTTCATDLRNWFTSSVSSRLVLSYEELLARVWAISRSIKHNDEDVEVTTTSQWQHPLHDSIIQQQASWHLKGERSTAQHTASHLCPPLHPAPGVAGTSSLLPAVARDDRQHPVRPSDESRCVCGRYRPLATPGSE